MKYNNLIPNEIRTHFDIIEVKKDTEDSLVKGKIRCCDTNSFEVLVTGKVKYGICILQSPADSDAFQSGRCAKHNGRPETMYF